MLKKAGFCLVGVLFLWPAVSFSQSIRYVDSFFWGNMVDVAVQGNYAYCALSNGLEIIDISDTTLELTGKLYFNGVGMGIDVAGNYAYLADGDNGLQIIDVTDPHNPSLAGHYNTGGTTCDLQVFGNFAFMANESGIVIADVTDPYHPTFAGSYTTPTGSTRIYVHDLFAYVLSFWYDLYIYDVSYPYWPEVVYGIPTPGFSEDVFVADTLLFIADNAAGTQIYDVSWPRQPEYICNIPTDWYSVGVCSQDTFLYVVEIWDGLQTYNISDIANPQLLSVYDTPGAAWKVDIRGQRAYVADYDYGLVTVNLSDPLSPSSMGNFECGRSIWDMKIQGDYAFIVDGGFKSLDISNYLQPRIVSDIKFNEEEAYFGFAKAGDYAYIGIINFYTETSRLAIIDISNLTEPIEVNSYSLQMAERNIVIRDNYAYIAEDGFGLEIIDISNQTQPQNVSYFATNSPATDLVLDGEYLFMACGDSGLFVLDIADPANPRRIGSFPADFYVCKVRVRDNYAYVIDRGMLFRILDISNLSEPTVVGDYNVPGGLNLYDICLYGDYALVSGVYPSSADYHGNIFALDISDPSTPRFIAGYNVPGIGNSILPYNDIFYVGTSNSLMALQFDPTAITENERPPNSDYALLVAYPNPFNSATTITIAGEERAEIGIYDINGRKIISLKAEHGRAVWDATGFSSGVYFARVNSDKASAIKLILLK